MQSLKRSAVLLVLLLFFATPCLGESSFKSICEDVFYGTLSGSLVGAAVLAFTKHPGDHVDFIGYGAAGGAVVGATYGAVVASRSLPQSQRATTRSLAEFDNGDLIFSVPTILPEFRDHGGQTAIVATTQLFRGRF